MVLIQSELVWEDPAENRMRFERHFDKITGSPDVVVLPEMFTTGFSMNAAEVAEMHHPDNMTTLNWMRSWAKKLNAVITGSVAVSEEQLYYNRLYWVLPDGRFNTYDKRHTFSLAGEHKTYHHGQSRIIEEWRGWKICPLICYDLRFPVWSRNGIEENQPLYDVLIYVANWPEVRREPWNKLLLARAIENQCFVAGINRVGTDGSGHDYSGDSVAISPKGEIIAACTPHKEEVVHVLFSAQELSDFREKFPVLFDADRFVIDGRRMRT